MEEIIWNICLGKLNVRWTKNYYAPFIKHENGKDFKYFGIGKLSFVIYEKKRYFQKSTAKDGFLWRTFQMKFGEPFLIMRIGTW